MLESVLFPIVSKINEYLSNYILIFLLVGGSRLAWRLFLNHPIGERLRGVPNKDPNRPVMIVGAGEAGAWAINVCKSNSSYGHPVVAVDDDLVKQGQTIGITGSTGHSTGPHLHFEVVENNVRINPLSHGAAPKKGYLTGYTLSGTSVGK